MCVLCGYIGKEPAAPILLRMGERMEGLWSGFYTGIGTLGDDGVIRHYKTTGYSRHWRERFSTDDLPGTMGFFHSRTNSGGDAKYAHPFVSSDGSTMLVSQGSSGVFAGREQAIVDIANMLLENGVRFASADSTLTYKKYPVLKDGSQVHVSDIVCEYAAWLHKTIGNPLEAVRKTGSDILEEAISLYIFRDHPGHVYSTNVNSRLALRFKPDSVVMSSSTLAFDDDGGDPVELTSNSVADISLKGIRMERLSGELTVLPVKDQEGLTAEVLDWIRNNPGTIEARIKDEVLNHRCFGDKRELCNAQTHPLVERLLAEGLIRMESKEVPGPAGSGDFGWQTAFFIK